MEILRVEHLSKVYGKGDNCVKALDDISFSVEKGDFVSIIGPSGSGKSTLLHILGGVDKPTSGKVFMNGQDVYAGSDDQLAVFRRREVGLIYQFYNLIPVLNVVGPRSSTITGTISPCFTSAPRPHSGFAWPLRARRPCMR